MKIGLYGGSFNPVHIWHIMSANILLSENYLDRVIMIPTYWNKFCPNKPLISGYHRMAMLSLATEGNPNIVISDYDLFNENHQSYQTISYFWEMNKDKDVELFFIMGGDTFNTFTEWKAWKFIVDRCKLLVIPRETTTLDQESLDLLGDKVIVCNQLEKLWKELPSSISSTKIRSKILNDEFYLHLFNNPSIAHYIQKHNLFVDGMTQRLVLSV